MPSDDPPFYLKQGGSSGEDTPPPYELSEIRNGRINVPTISHPSRYPAFDSGSEDFRSVIDDLTIKNRNLKRKIKQFERLYNAQRHADKLFEVRVHGLPPHKKRKLERTLQDFASSLGEGTEEQSVLAITQNAASAASRHLPSGLDPSSPSTSNSRPVDSAYASMSTSGGTSMVQSRDSKMKQSLTVLQTRDQDVRSYLQTIPRRPPPRNSLPLTEKAKKRLVVRRLEQLFTGKTASYTLHSQHAQQQEISQSAAVADRRSTEARGLHVEAEGVREAKILLSGANSIITGRNNTRASHSSEDTGSTTTHQNCGAIPDQRPTRPIDLDPSRAQDPMENIEYIRHLGFDLPKTDSMKNVEKGRGWIYLNLLINMAQLHTVNVTLEFVRDAVHKFSEKFELSPDGRYIRWTGGFYGTCMSDHGGRSTIHSHESYQEEFEFKRDSASISSGLEFTDLLPVYTCKASYGGLSCAVAYPGTHVHRSQCRSLFDPSEDESVRQCPSYDRGYTVSNMTNTECGCPSQLSSMSILHDDLPGISTTAGPIIFYNEARFYTDLSQDIGEPIHINPVYTRYIESIVGCEFRGTGIGQTAEEFRGLLSDDSFMESIQMARIMVIENLDVLWISAGTSPRHDTYQYNLTHLEASGVGGVQPEDNFSIKVCVQHTALPSIPMRTEILSVDHLRLAPSTLPPPSYTFHPFSSSGSDEGSHYNDETGDASAASVSHTSISAGHGLRLPWLAMGSTQVTGSGLA